MRLGERIRTERLIRGFSQEYVAEKLGISTSAYGNIERDEVSTTDDRLKQIAEVLGIKLEDLLRLEGTYIFINSGDNSCQQGHGNHYEYSVTEREQQLERELALTRELNESLKRENEALRKG